MVCSHASNLNSLHINKHCALGGIVSPLFANIYLNELDVFAAKLAEEFYKPREQEETDEYHRLSKEIKKITQRLKSKKANGEKKTELLRQQKILKNLRRKTPRLSQTDKIIKYIRYADDFIIGIKGDKSDCVWIKQQLSEFIRHTLKMELSEEKTLITHSSERARFLGYDIRVRRDSQVHPRNDGVLQRTFNYSVELNIPFADKIMPYLFERGVVVQKDGKIYPASRTTLLHCTALEILTVYNAELRGICNYYAIASNFYKLNYFSYLMEYSCLKTLARKFNCSIRKLQKKYRRDKGGWAIPYDTKQGKNFMYFAKYSDCRKGKTYNDAICNAYAKVQTTTTLEKRLAAKQCELCGATDIKLELHHVNKVKNLKGKVEWERIMIAKRRKTLAVCKSCHHKIHYPESA